MTLCFTACIDHSNNPALKAELILPPTKRPPSWEQQWAAVTQLQSCLLQIASFIRSYWRKCDSMGLLLPNTHSSQLSISINHSKIYMKRCTTYTKPTLSPDYHLIMYTSLSTQTHRVRPPEAAASSLAGHLVEGRGLTHSTKKQL